MRRLVESPSHRHEDKAAVLLQEGQKMAGAPANVFSVLLQSTGDESRLELGRRRRPDGFLGWSDECGKVSCAPAVTRRNAVDLSGCVCRHLAIFNLTDADRNSTRRLLKCVSTFHNSSDVTGG